MAVCRECGEPVEAGNVLCPQCASGDRGGSATRAGAPASGPAASAQSVASTSVRYSDAYKVSHSAVAIGGVIKWLGYLLGTLTVAAGMLAAQSLGSDASGLVIIGAIAYGAGVMAVFYALGTLVSAVGQILMATLDTAVNTAQGTKTASSAP